MTSLKLELLGCCCVTSTPAKLKPHSQARRTGAGKRTREDPGPGGSGSGAGRNANLAKLAKLGSAGAVGKVMTPGTDPVGPGRHAQPGAQAAWAPSPSRLRGSSGGGALHATQTAPNLLAGPKVRLHLNCAVYEVCAASQG